MGVMPNSLAILLMAWGTVTAVMVGLVIYGNTLDIHETEEFYVNKKEEVMMSGGQKALIAGMEQLKKVIFSLAVVSGILLVAAATMWTYIGLTH